MTAQKRIKVKVGDIFAVPLADQLVAAGIVLHISRYWANGILVGFFDRRFPAVDQIDVSDLAAEFVFTPNYTAKRILTAGDWPIVGNRADLVVPSVIPKLVSVYDVFYKDEIVERLASIEETRQYEVLSGWGKVFAENKLRRHFVESAA